MNPEETCKKIAIHTGITTNLDFFPFVTRILMENKMLSTEDILEHIKKTRGWKTITKKRWKGAILDAYILGRDGFKLEKDVPSAFELLPKFKVKKGNLYGIK